MNDYYKNDGGVYSGDMKKKQNTKFVFFSHGKGKQKNQDGSHYDGDWRNNLCEGQGTLKFANGLFYTG